VRQSQVVVMDGRYDGGGRSLLLIEAFAGEELPEEVAWRTVNVIVNWGY
jgi:hypothetical protein